MDVGKAVILGVIQGLTEFLPVSSSGHLVLGIKRGFGLIPEQDPGQSADRQGVKVVILFGLGDA